MEMQDKEFDGLFRSKLNDFEIQPSPGVWPAIDAEIDGRKRKKLWLPILSAAASILVLLTAGVLFFTGKPLKGGTHPVKSALAHEKPVIDSLPIEKKNDGKHLSGKSIPAKVNATVIAVNQPKKVHRTHRLNNILDDAATDDKTAKGNPKNTPDGQTLTASTTPRQEAIIDVAPVNNIPIKQRPEQTIADLKPAILVTPVPALTKKDAPAVKTRHKIRTIGDLVNAVVAKVDKRKDKVIEFTNTDDDESSITGVNLGIIKIKKD